MATVFYPSPKLTAATALRRQIMQLLQDHGPATTAAIVKRLGLPESKVRGALNGLRQSLNIRPLNGGRQFRGRGKDAEFTWNLTGAGLRELNHTLPKDAP